jgi:hypothetical protein
MERGGHVGAVIPSFLALSERLKFTVRRHTFNKDSLSWYPAAIYLANGSNAKPMAPTCAESSEPCRGRRAAAPQQHDSTSAP